MTERIKLKRVVSVDRLRQAWRFVRANNGAPGVDEVSCQAYEQDLDRNLQDLSEQLITGLYAPAPLRQVAIAKTGGGERLLSIPIIHDRVAQRAFADALEPVFEPRFRGCSYGYRPGRSVSDAVDAVERYRSAGMRWIVDADIRDFFGSIRHDRLLRILRSAVRDEAIIRIVSLWLITGDSSNGLAMAASRVGDGASRIASGIDRLLACTNLIGPEADFTGSDERSILVRREVCEAALRVAGILAPGSLRAPLAIGGGCVAALGMAAAALRRRCPNGGTGLAQGSPLSPLLANVYLHEFDEHITARSITLVRYADDFLLCASSQARAEGGLRTAGEELAKLSLAINPLKTQLIEPDAPFRFLGYEFDKHGATRLPDRKFRDTALLASSRVRARGRIALRYARGRVADIADTLRPKTRETQP